MHTKLKIANGILIGLGIGHAMHVSRAEDIEPYLWVFSLFLVVLGTLNFRFIQRDG